MQGVIIDAKRGIVRLDAEYGEAVFADAKLQQPMFDLEELPRAGGRLADRYDAGIANKRT